MIIKKLDSFRKKIKPTVIRRIGKYHFVKKVKGTKQTEINKILICRPNQRLGNMLLLTPLIQEAMITFPNCKIDIIVKGGVANIVFKEYQCIQNIIILPRKPFKELFKYLKIFLSVKIKKYDLVINGEKSSSSGKILTYLANAKYKVYGTLKEESNQEIEADYEHMAKSNVYNLRYYLEQIGYSKNTTDIPNIDLMLSENELLKGKEILDQHVENPIKPTILIFTFATGTKCYSTDWWHAFYKQLKSTFGKRFNILEVLPMENVSQIDFKETSYYSKDVREIASVIANAELFIGADSGIMHLASASGSTTVGLFAVTIPEKYKPYGKKNDYINTNIGTVDDYIQNIASKLDAV